jgi:multiple sugar transport system permease protein
VSNKRKNLLGILFASPWIIGFLIFSLYPIIASFYYSFTTFNLFKPPQFVFLDNYKTLLASDLFWKSLFNTFYMTVIGTPLFLITGLVMALLQNLKIKGQSFYRTIFYLPTIVPIVATSMIWLWILNPQNGLINSLLKLIGISGPNWLADAAYTKPSLVIIGMWTVGNIMIYFLAALQEIPVSLMESAELDGATPIRKFFSITLPYLSPIILYQLIVNIIYNFQYFTQAYMVILGSGAQGTAGMVLGSGGPENSLLFYALYLYHKAFVFFKMGEASAMAWLLFILVAVITWIILKTSNRWVNYGGE